MKKFRIGNVTINNRYILAPMAGISDLPFRCICSEMGAGMTCMEMVSAKAVSFNNKKTYEMLKVGEKENVVSLQIFGSDPYVMAEVTKFLDSYPFDIIDINMGCPVPKVVKNGEGSALLKDPVRVGHIVEGMVKATSKPVTAKIRTGFSKEKINAVEIARIIQESGGAAVTVHGRTREQYYEGEANWEEIAKVKEAIRIPVIGNGDLFSVEDVKRMEKTGVDGFAIARGARGNPWIFRELIEYEKTGMIPERPKLYEIKNQIIDHANALIRQKGEYIGIREMRKHSSWYLAGRRNVSKLRGRLNEIETIDDLCRMLELLT